MGFFITEEILFQPAARTPKTAYPLAAKDVSGHRYFQPETGRWIGRDPIGIRGGKNIYNLCGNTPIVKTDPFGLADKSSCCDDKKYDAKKSCCYDSKVIPVVSESTTGYKVCCRPVEGYSWIKHCELRYGECSAEHGEKESYPVTKADSGNMDNGKPCRCATVDDLKDCAGVMQEPEEELMRPGDRMGRHHGGNGTGYWWGSNCQSQTLEQMRSCCMKSSWQPNWYAYDPFDNFELPVVY